MVFQATVGGESVLAGDTADHQFGPLAVVAVHHGPQRQASTFRQTYRLCSRTISYNNNTEHVRIAAGLVAVVCIGIPDA